MTQAKAIFYTALDLPAGEELEITCTNEINQKRLLSELEREIKHYLKNATDFRGDTLKVRKERTQEGLFLIVLFQEENIILRAVIKKKDGKEEKINFEDLKLFGWGDEIEI